MTKPGTCASASSRRTPTCVWFNVLLRGVGLWSNDRTRRCSGTATSVRTHSAAHIRRRLRDTRLATQRLQTLLLSGQWHLQSGTHVQTHRGKNTMLYILSAMYRNILYLFQIIIHIFFNEYYFVVNFPTFFDLQRPSSGTAVT